MIHTVSLNPAVDQTVTLSALIPGEMVRADTTRFNPGGKAVNVASCLADWGDKVTIHGLLGAENTASFEALFAQKGIEDRMIRIAGATRTNIKIVERGGRTTDVNLPGFSATADQADQVRQGLGCLTTSAWVVISGSQPAGLGPDATALLIADANARGAKVVLDVSGAPLAAALAEGVTALPYAIKPNQHELESLVGHPFADRAGVVSAARGLIARGIGIVVVSLGTDGAVFLTAQDGVHVRPVALSYGSTVGAGDAMVAGLTSALTQGLGLADLARRATAFAAGKLQNVGPHLPPNDIINTLAAGVALSSVADWVAAA